MPYLNLQTTQSLPPEIGKGFLKSASRVVVEHLGKPESVMMTALHEPVAMTLGGDDRPAAILELSVLDLDAFEVEGLYAALHALAEKELGPSAPWSDLYAASLLALDRTSRGTQSIVRNSSSIAPRIRGTQ